MPSWWGNSPSSNEKKERSVKLLPILDTQRPALIACIAIVVFSIVFNFVFFDLKTIQGQLYVVFVEAVLQGIIFRIAIAGDDTNFDFSPKRALQIVCLLSSISFAFKALFVQHLASLPMQGDMSDIFPFTLGNNLGVIPIADARIDGIANVLYQCGMCVGSSEIPLNEPGIAYLFVLISTIAGEFNQHILWITLHAVNFAAALVLLKTAKHCFPNSRYVILLPLIYILLTDVHGVTLALHKDGLIAFLLVSMYYVNFRLSFSGIANPLLFVLCSACLIVFTYELRSGLLAFIFGMTVLNLIFNWKNRFLYIQIIVVSMVAIWLLASFGGIGTRLDVSVKRVADKLMFGSDNHLDVENLSYTTSEKESLLGKVRLHRIEPGNFFYAPFVKSALFFLLPLPVGEFVNFQDAFHKIATLLYWCIFPLFLVGVYRIVTSRNSQDWYLLTMFALCMAPILGAGSMIYPRYRIMASAFLLLVACLGATRISEKVVTRSVALSFFMVTAVVLGYDKLHELARQLTS